MQMSKRIELIKPSTRTFFRESKKLGRYGLAEWLHGYVYGRWIYHYIGIGTGEHFLVKTLKPIANLLLWFFNKALGTGSQQSNFSFADSYHGKVVTLENARCLVTVNEPIILPNLEKVVPYSRARDIILRNPDHIAVMACPCRSVRENPCLPLDVCIIVGEPFTSFAVEHHPGKAQHITQDEAMTIIEAENRRGHVAHAFFKDAMLDRFYAICNCCSCCCGAMQAHRNGTPMLASSGYVCSCDHDTCVSCGTCVELCQFAALDLDGQMEVKVASCMGCGVCVNNCPAEALTLVRDVSRGEPLEIHNLMSAAQQNKAGISAR
ncbi:MAG: 4Fe-4S binding protein [Deltaproteobacteria bacterium]|nr:4Fe-4S binding protein [Deltaproteobacteria bacterium]